MDLSGQLPSAEAEARGETQPSDAVAKLLQTSCSVAQKKGSLIQVVGEEREASLAAPQPVVENEPTMMEIMIAAQLEAAMVVQREKDAELKKASKTGFTGFKKGFFGQGKPTKEPSKIASLATKTKAPGSVAKEPEVIEVRATSKTGAPAATAKGMVFDEVQQAMEADQHPLLQQVRKGDWVTPELTTVLMSHPVLRAGLSHPKCQAALQLLQSDPKAAKDKFQHDPEVSLFLQEFGKVMAAHFDALGAQQGAAAPTATPSTGLAAAPAEMGPLQAKVLEKAAVGAGIGTVPAKADRKTKIEEVDPEQQRVNAILQDSELRDLLMDGSMQRVLMDCADPIKFRQHLQDPATARKLRKLQDAGLVQIQM